MIDTPRLTIIPLTLEQLRLHIANRHELEKTLGLQKGHRQVMEPVRSIISLFHDSPVAGPRPRSVIPHHVAGH